MKDTKNYIINGTEQPGNGQNNTPGGNDHNDEEELLARCCKDDMAAFGKLIEKYQDRLFNVILRMVSNYDDAQELSQEAFCRAVKGIKKFRGNSCFYTWLFRIGMNLSINYRHHKELVHFSSIDSLSDSTGRQADGLKAILEAKEDISPLGKAQLKEGHQRVLQALERLEPPAKAVVILRDIEGLSYSQIARILDVPAGTVKSRLCRARTILRKMLAG